MTRTFRVGTTLSRSASEPSITRQASSSHRGSKPDNIRTVSARSQPHRASVPPGLWRQLDRTVEALLESHKATDGATVDLVRGNLIGLPLFSVAAFTKQTVEFADIPTAANVYDFIIKNLKILLRQNRAIGSWFDTRRSLHALDVVVCYRQRDQALKVAARLRQDFNYDLSARTVIPVEQRIPLSVATSSLSRAGAFGLGKGR